MSQSQNVAANPKCNIQEFSPAALIPQRTNNIILQPALTWTASQQHILRGFDVNWVPARIGRGHEIGLDLLAGTSFVNQFRWTGRWFKMWWIVARLLLCPVLLLLLILHVLSLLLLLLLLPLLLVCVQIIFYDQGGFEL